jgi:hypothetical protein
MEQTVSLLCQHVMRAVASTGAVRSEDAELACRIMREELKSFLFAGKYADERAVAMTGNSNLAVASLKAECVRRILAERATVKAHDGLNLRGRDY